ncbi:MAG: GHKL domain-containing protein, partial [Deltaproteobacteria bacterium]|nr:GHKL domain-containing protein [Deltaproteobacteria bacterium]
ELTHNPQLEQLVDKSLSMQENDFVELCEELSSAGESADGTSGATTVLTARCVPFRDRIGRNLGAVTLLHDITTLKKMDQLKSDFVSMVAHEIRSPLNTVLMQLKVVLDGLAGELTHKQHEFLDRATEKIKGLISLATELLDLAKIESGLLSQERRQINLVAFLNDQVAFHLPRAQAKNIALSLQPPVPPVPPLLANQQNMEEVFGNLISNAINYTPEGGTIILAVTVAGDCVCISVADTGIGIPEEDLERIFERFYRVKDESTKYVIGTGLGLAIVKSIVESHHGRISVTSQPGRGTAFTVYLPLVTS